MFGVLLALCLLPLYVRGSFFALLRKVEKRLSDSRKSTEGQELPAYAKLSAWESHLILLPWVQHHWPRGGMEPCQANPQAEHSVLSVLSSSCRHGHRHFLAGLEKYPGNGNDQHFPKEAVSSEEKNPLLCCRDVWKAKMCIFKFLTDIAESESERAVLWDMLGFAFSFL